MSSTVASAQTVAASASTSTRKQSKAADVRAQGACADADKVEETTKGVGQRGKNASKGQEWSWNGARRGQTVGGATAWLSEEERGG